jgi:hypothetical protein
MRAWIIPVAIGTSALCGGVVRADQCAWLGEAEVAARAARELARSPTIVELCEPCGQLAPGAPERVDSIAVRPVDGGAHEVVVNGRALDLAYTFIPIASRQYRNLALLVGCPATGVSPGLRVEESTASGVLIVADGVHRLAAPSHALSAPELMPAPGAWASLAPGQLAASAGAAPAAPAQVIVHLAAPPVPSGWIAALLACGAAIAGGVCWGAVAILARRRRRTLLPRATGLRADLSSPPRS